MLENTNRPFVKSYFDLLFELFEVSSEDDIDAFYGGKCVWYSETDTEIDEENREKWLGLEF